MTRTGGARRNLHFSRPQWTKNHLRMPEAGMVALDDEAELHWKRSLAIKSVELVRAIPRPTKCNLRQW
jgi:hypothetical protein